MLEEVLSKQPGTEFCAAKLKNLLPKSKFEEETTNSINDIYEFVTEESDPTSEKVNIDLIKDYLKKLTGVEYLYKTYEPYMYNTTEYNEYLSKDVTMGNVLYGVNLEKMKDLANKKDALIPYNNQTFSEIYAKEIAEEHSRMAEEENRESQDAIAACMTKKFRTR